MEREAETLGELNGIIWSRASGSDGDHILSEYRRSGGCTYPVVPVPAPVPHHVRPSIAVEEVESRTEAEITEMHKVSAAWRALSRIVARGLEGFLSPDDELKRVKIGVHSTDRVAPLQTKLSKKSKPEFSGSLGKRTSSAETTPTDASSPRADDPVADADRPTQHPESGVRSMILSWCHRTLADGRSDLNDADMESCNPQQFLFEWHPTEQWLCLCSDDTIRFLDVKKYEDVERIPSDGSGMWNSVILRHRHQRDVRVLSWRPMANRTVAVGGRGYVCLWTMKYDRLATKLAARTPKKSLIAPLSSAEVTALPVFVDSDHPAGNADVSMLSWSSDGSWLAIATSSPLYPAVRVYDVVADEIVTLPVPSKQCKVVTGVEFSPDMRLLAVIYGAEKRFAIYDTRTWQNKVWTVPQEITATHWHDSLLCIALKSSSHLIFMRFFLDSPEDSAVTKGQKSRGFLGLGERGSSIRGAYLPSVDLRHDLPDEVFASGGILNGARIDSETDLLGSQRSPSYSSDLDDPSLVLASGDTNVEVTDFAIDPVGERMLINLRVGQRELVLLLTVDIHDTAVRLSYRGVVTPADTSSSSTATRLSFWNGCEDGSLVAVAWGSDRICLYPFHYTSRKEIQANPAVLLSNWYDR